MGRSALGSERQLARGEDPRALCGDNPGSYSFISLRLNSGVFWANIFSASGFDFSQMIYSVDPPKSYHKIISSCSIGHLS